MPLHAICAGNASYARDDCTSEHQQSDYDREANHEPDAGGRIEPIRFKDCKIGKCQFLPP